MIRKVKRKKNKNEFNPNIFQETTRTVTRLNNKGLLNELIESVKLPKKEWSDSYIKSIKLQYLIYNLAYNPNDEKDNLIYKYSENILLKRCDSEIIPIKDYILNGEQIDVLPNFLKYLNDCIINFEDRMELFLLIERNEIERRNETKMYTYYFILRSDNLLYEYKFDVQNSTDFLNDLIDKIDSFHNLSIAYDFLNFEPKIIIESKYKKIKIEYYFNSKGNDIDIMKIWESLDEPNNIIDPKSFYKSKTINLTSDRDYEEIIDFIMDLKDHYIDDYEYLDFNLKINDCKLFIYIKCNEKLFSYEFIPKDSKFLDDIKTLASIESIILRY